MTSDENNFEWQGQVLLEKLFDTTKNSWQIDIALTQLCEFKQWDGVIDKTFLRWSHETYFYSMQLLVLPVVEPALFEMDQSGFDERGFPHCGRSPLQVSGFCSINLEKIKPQNTHLLSGMLKKPMAVHEDFNL